MIANSIHVLYQTLYCIQSEFFMNPDTDLYSVVQEYQVQGSCLLENVWLQCSCCSINLIVGTCTQ